MSLAFTKVNAQEVDARIKEIFKDAPQEYNDASRLAFLNDILQNRFKIIESPVSTKETYAKLSSVSLQNKYNHDLTRDVVFDPQNFNPLKYSFNFSSFKEEIGYRVDGTNYIIVIKPQILNK